MRTTLAASALLTALLAAGVAPGSLTPAHADRLNLYDRDRDRSAPADRGGRLPPGQFRKERADRRYDDRGAPPRHAGPRRPARPWYRDNWHRYPYRPYYPPYRHFHRSDDFWGWVAFTAITLAIIDSLNEQQQREHELAMREALRAPVGETVRWNDRGASGSVTVTRDGTSSAGRYCREYSQQITVGGESQQAYGTACRNPDGSWEILD
jgi:hypothetical protein